MTHRAADSDLREVTDRKDKRKSKSLDCGGVPSRYVGKNAPSINFPGLRTRGCHEAKTNGQEGAVITCKVETHCAFYKPWGPEKT